MDRATSWMPSVCRACASRLGRDGARCLEGPFPPSPLV
jgi:hypothetical protein